MASELVALAEICRMLAGTGKEPVTKMTVSRFVSEGMPKASRGRYDGVACLMWYVARLRETVQLGDRETEDGKVVRLDEAQRRLTLAKAENEEMTAKERRGELLPLSLHIAEMAKLVTVTKQKFLNLPARIAPKLEGLSRNETKALLTASVKSALSDLARGADSTSSVAAVGPQCKAEMMRQRSPKRGTASV